VLSTQNDKQSEAKTFKLKKFDSTSLYTTKLSPELLVKSDKLTLDFELHTGKKIQADWKIDLYK